MKKSIKYAIIGAVLGAIWGVLSIFAPSLFNFCFSWTRMHCDISLFQKIVFIPAYIPAVFFDKFIRGALIDSGHPLREVFFMPVEMAIMFFGPIAIGVATGLFMAKIIQKLR